MKTSETNKVHKMYITTVKGRKLGEDPVRLLLTAVTMTFVSPNYTRQSICTNINRDSDTHTVLNNTAMQANC